MDILCCALMADGEGSDERFEEYVDTIESLGTTANEVRPSCDDPVSSFIRWKFD